MKTLIATLILFTFNYSFSQDIEISKTISESLNDVIFEVRLNRLAKLNNQYKNDDIIKIFAVFEINENGNISVASINTPSSKISQAIYLKLSRIIIPKELLSHIEINNFPKDYTLPIFYQVKSKSEIKKIIRKYEKRKNIVCHLTSNP